MSPLVIGASARKRDRLRARSGIRGIGPEIEMLPRDYLSWHHRRRVPTPPDELSTGSGGWGSRVLACGLTGEMADLIEFPGTRALSVAPYQLHRLALDGSVRSTIPIRAKNDAGARRQARRLAAGSRFDLLSNGRFLDHFAAVDHPTATAIRLLDDQTPPGSR